MADQSTELLYQMANLALKGKTVLITGASGGIGQALCTVFRRSGCNLILLGSRQSKLDQTVSQLPEGEGKVWSFECDLSKKHGEIEEVVLKIGRECAEVDFLINNAGYALGATAPFWEQDFDNVDSVLGVNVDGLMALTHYILKHQMMVRKPQPTGTILNVSSITGHQAPLKEGFEVSYHTSKAAVEAFTNVLRHETINTNLRILLHRPGTALTEFHSRRLAYNSSATDSLFAGMQPLVPMDLAVGILWQCLQPERISVVVMETLPTAQRSLYAVDREWEERNGKGSQA